jgi:putative ABC transport system ATP-binding protein
MRQMSEQKTDTITCPKCEFQIETTGLVTKCPKCGEDLVAVLRELGHIRKSRAGIARDDSATTHEFIVRTKSLVKEYVMGDITVRALDGVDLDVRRGEYLSIMGPSGSGKSTLFNMVGGLDKPTSGTCFIDEVDMAQLDAFELAWLRCRKIGYIFQTFNLIPVMTAMENVTLPMIFAGMGTDEMLDRGRELLDLVGLGERWNHKPFELSGGQQQRVAIARSLANAPAIILADEPTGNLDLRTGREIIELLKELNDRDEVTIITATHDLKMIEASDRVVHIRDGKIERVDRREDLKVDVGTIDGEQEL